MLTVIFCVEDDPNIRELEVYTLQSVGYQAIGAGSGEELFEMLEKEKPLLIILDIMLPKEDGITVLKKLRNNKATIDIPVIMATAKGTEFDKVQGLDCGADDYITKPFGMMEMVSRVKAVLRRSSPAIDGEVKQLIVGDLIMDIERHHVLVKGEELVLTLKEFEVLHSLMKKPGRVFTREQLLSDIWGYDFTGETRTVDVHIRTLRVKMGASGALIETVRGVGYRMGVSNEK